MIGKLKGRKKEILLLPLDLYAGLMVAYLVMRSLSTRIYIWPIEIVSAYLHLLLLPTIALLMVALALRSWHTVLLLSIGAIAYVWLFCGLFLPNGGKSRQEAELIVMTYNTGNGIAPWGELARVIRGSGADVVAIQESIDAEIPMYRRDLDDIYPHQVFYSSGLEGIGLLSRYPILNEETKYLSSSRPYLNARIALPDRTVTVINGHPPVIFGPGAGEDDGRSDFTMMANLAIGQKPAVILGDLNISDQNEGYSALMRHDLTDAHRSAGMGLGLTYPVKFNSRRSIPWIRIDYILTTNELQPIETWIGEDGGSDHLPVLTALAWSQQN